MNTIYKRKRLRTGLSKYTMAKEMGITKEQWENIEEGKIALESEWVDKFNDAINRAPEIKINRIQKIFKIKEAISSGVLKQKLKEQGYSSRELSNKLGLGNTTVCDALKGKKASDDMLELIYDFLMNPANKNLKPIKRGRKPLEKTNKENQLKGVIEQAEALEEPIEAPKPYMDVETLLEENARLRKQLERYEKLIDRM